MIYKVGKWLLILILLALFATMVFFSFIYTAPQSSLVAQSTLSQETLIKKGAYLAQAANCAGCHTDHSQNGVVYTGGRAVATPVGTIYSTNITPDEKTGIGSYTLQEFDNTVRYGIRKNGSGMYPAMPFIPFSIIADEDIEALYTYFMHGIDPIEQHNKTSEIPWPLSMRWPLTAWHMLYAPEVNPRF